MRWVLLVIVLALAAAAGWWAWRDHRARQPHGVLLGTDYVPSPSDTTAAPPEVPATTGTVARLPRGSGRIQGSTRRGSVRTGLGSRVEARGTMDWMTGAHSVTFDVNRSLFVTVEASVAAGRLRVYLGDGAGYRYAEAVPGSPLRLSGPLIAGTSGYLFYSGHAGPPGRVSRR